MGTDKRLLTICGAIAGAAAISVAAGAFADDTNIRAGTPMVLAQAGSTGGTIGKQGKSAAGGGEETKSVSAREEPSSGRRGTSSRRRSREGGGQSLAGIERRSNAAGCSKIAGRWDWTFGVVVTFNTDGSFLYDMGDNRGNGRWTCSGERHYVFHYTSGGWNGATERHTMSDDGNTLSGVSSGTGYLIPYSVHRQQ